MKLKFKPMLIFIFILTLVSYKSWAAILVNGEATVSAAPDLAQFNINIETTSKTAKQAAVENAKQADQVVKLVKTLVPENDAVSTQNYNIYPDYKYNKNSQESELTGYKVVNQINIKTKDLKNIGSLLDKLTEAGVNSINNLNFSLSDNSELYKQALEKAVVVASERAQVLAKAGNLKLGRIKDIESGIVSEQAIPRPLGLRMAAAEMDATTPIQAGDIKTRAVVSVEFEAS